MQPFIANITSFPTVIFTAFRGAVVLYWGLIIMGLVDVSMDCIRISTWMWM